MRLAFKWIIFSMLCVNVAIGAMYIMIHEMKNIVLIEANLDYIAEDSQWVEGLNTSVNPSGVLEDRGNAIYRLLDSINLGFIARLLDLLQTGMFGFENLLRGIFDGPMRADNPTMANYWFGTPTTNFGIIKGLTIILYGITAISFWTGKDMDD